MSWTRRSIMAALGLAPVLTRALRAQPASVVSVASFGADHTGHENSSPHIQSALDTLAPIVTIPTGRFKLNEPLILRSSGQALVGMGVSSILFAGREDIRGIIVPEAVQNITLRDFSLLGTAVNSSARHVGVHVLPRITRAREEYAPPPTPLVAISGLRFSGTEAKNGWTIAVHNDLSPDCEIRNCVVERVVGQKSGSGYGFLVTGPRARISNNFILSENIRDGRHGVYLGFGSDSLVDRNYISGFIGSGICSNTSVSNSDSRLVISKNTVIACGYGSPYQDDSAIGLYMQGDAQLAGHGSRITENSIIASGAHGIFCNGHSDLLISSNLIREFSLTKMGTHRAIAVWNSRRAYLSDNSISSRSSAIRPVIDLVNVAGAQVTSNSLHCDPCGSLPARSWISKGKNTEDVELVDNQVLSRLDLD